MTELMISKDRSKLNLMIHKHFPVQWSPEPVTSRRGRTNAKNPSYMSITFQDSISPLQTLLVPKQEQDRSYPTRCYEHESLGLPWVLYFESPLMKTSGSQRYTTVTSVLSVARTWNLRPSGTQDPKTNGNNGQTHYFNETD